MNRKFNSVVAALAASMLQACGGGADLNDQAALTAAQPTNTTVAQKIAFDDVVPNPGSEPPAPPSNNNRGRTGSWVTDPTALFIRYWSGDQTNPGGGATPAPANWMHCADDGQVCSFYGTKVVSYGVGSQWVSRVIEGPVQCDNTLAGDPAPGQPKACWISDNLDPQEPPSVN